MKFNNFIKGLAIFLGLYLILFLIIEQYCRRRGKSFHQILHPELYTLDFPESAFPPKKDVIKYEKSLVNGYKRMETLNVVLCGLCKDMGKEAILRFMHRAEKLSLFFRKMKIILFENDSSDCININGKCMTTREVLLNWEKQNPNVHVIRCENNCRFNEKGSVINHGVLSKGRMVKMAFFRDKYLQHVLQNYSDYDFMIVVDTDFEGAWSIDGIANTFSYSPFDMMGGFGQTGIALSMGKLFYYDCLSVRKGWIDPTKSKLHNAFVPLWLLKYGRGDKPIQVKSCFGGIAIYNIKTLKECQCHYVGDDNYCEHISLCDQMLDQGHDRIFINPNMLVLPGLQGDYKNLPIH